MAAVKAHDETLATRLVDVAARILDEEGAAALTLRRVATEAGTSTMAVYTLFGDKRGLLAAMHGEGFARLGQSMSTAAGADSAEPLEALAALGLAYRAAAQASPHLYGLMFGTAAPGFRPDAGGEAVADSTFRPLVAAVQRAIDAGALLPADAERIAFHLWAVSHGVVSLELAGQVKGDPDTVYRDAMVHAIAPFLPR